MDDAIDVPRDRLIAISSGAAEKEIGVEGILKTLASLTDAIATLQGDMSWVREDLGVVHEVMENIAEHVSTMGRSGPEPDGVLQCAALEGTTWCTWRGEGSGDEHGNEHMTTSDQRGKKHAREENANPVLGGDAAATSILETEEPYMDEGMQLNIATSAEEGDTCDWYNEGNTSPAMWSPPGKQRGPLDVEEVDTQDEETQDMHMSIKCTQGAPREGPVSLWAGFESTVRLVAADAEDGGSGWVASRRERGGSGEYGPDAGPQIGTSEGRQHATFNLNFSPGRVRVAHAMHGRGESAAGKNSVVNTGGQMRGRGRGNARVRRPPAVDPRYHSTASTQTSRPTATCVLLLSFVSMEEHGEV